MGIHKVQKHKWKDGILHTVEYVFHSLETAINFCENKRNHNDATALKVITPEGEVAHSVNPGGISTNTYA